ncbi:hypothetical protein HY483_01260 [Candidatus Woesearchaeota archaeon]|nr:hypothetical protein [Candidatus Woesearchaeota archaeon]
MSSFVVASKKSQTVSEMFVIIVAAFVLIIIILWGSRAIKSFTERTDDAKLVNFANDLRSNVENIAYQRGTVKHVEVSLPGGFSKVCFTERFKVNPLNYRAPTGTPDIVIQKSKTVDQNVFTIPPSDVSIKLKNLTVHNGILCLDSNDGVIDFRAEGSGKTVCVSKWGVVPLSIKDCK